MNYPAIKNSKSRRKRATIQSVTMLEERVWKAAQQRDIESFTRLVPSDAIMIFQSGIVAQPEYVATMPQRTISYYDLRNMQAFMPSPGIVILLYEATRAGSFRGKSFPRGSVIESTTWIKRGGGWVAVLNQETPVTEKK